MTKKTSRVTFGLRQQIRFSNDIQLQLDHISPRKNATLSLFDRGKVSALKLVKGEMVNLSGIDFFIDNVGRSIVMLSICTAEDIEYLKVPPISRSKPFKGVKSPSSTKPLIVTTFKGNFEPDEIEKCLEYLAEVYRLQGGTGLKIVKAEEHSYDTSEVPCVN